MTVNDLDAMEPPPDAALPPEYETSWWVSLYASPLLHIAYMALLILALIDCYRRYGYHIWLLIIFIAQPVGPLAYLILHGRFLLRGIETGGTSGRGLFGLGLKARIRKAEQQMRLAETEAAKAELAELYYEAGRYEDSERLFRKLLEIDPENQEALYHLGLCALVRKDAAQALEFLESVMKRNKKYRFGRAWLRYAECLAAAGRKEAALEEARQLCRAFPRPLTEYAYARFLAEAGQQGKSREVLEEMIATCGSAPSEDRVWVRKGKSLLRSLA